MINLNKKQKSELPPTRKITDIEKELISLLLNFPVHMELIREKMENVYKFKVPIKVEMGLGDNWGEAH